MDYDMKAILKVTWFTPGQKGRWGLPMTFVGKPGIGKTSVIEQLAAALGLPVEVVIGSLREPSDFLGLPVPTADAVAYMPPAWARHLAGAGAGVAFFDEVNSAPPAVQSALLRVILDGVVGDLALPARVRCIAAMNPVEEAAGGHDLAAPLANRFGHMEWPTVDPSDWSDWLLGPGGNGSEHGEGLDAEKEEKRVLKAWPTPWAKARGLVAGFIRKRGELLLKMPAAHDPAASRAWPSPRTWEYAARAMAGAEVHGLRDLEADCLVAAFVGEGAAGELFTYRREADLPDPADVLDGKVEFKHEPKRLDRTTAVLAACAALVTPQKAEKRNERAGALWKLFAEPLADAADVVVPAARALVKARLSGLPEARPALVRLQPVLAAAGIVA